MNTFKICIFIHCKYTLDVDIHKNTLQGHFTTGRDIFELMYIHIYIYTYTYFHITHL